jgi:hypothetical protein
MAVFTIGPVDAQVRPRPATPSGTPAPADPGVSRAPAHMHRAAGGFGPGMTGWAAAADHIIGQQCVDDGWGWPHASCGATFHNITGPIASGLLRAYDRTGSAPHLAAADLAGDFDLLSAYPDINEVQRISVPLDASGTFTISFNGDGPTAALSIETAAAVDVEAALESLTTIDDVTVSENLSPRRFDVTFVGAMVKNTDVPLITVDNSLNTGSDLTVNETAKGGGGAEARFGTFTATFMQRLSARTGDPTHVDFAAAELFDELTLSSYGPSDLDTAGWIASVQAARAGTWINLLPWEFHLLISTADTIGNPGQDDLFRQALLDGLDTLDNTSPASVYSDIIGLAGAVRGLAQSDTSSFPAISSPNHGLIDGVSSLCVLANTLAMLQNADGSWYWHSDLSSLGGATVGDEDGQTTAYAVLALLEAQRAGCGPFGTQIADGRAWLWSMQDVDGGFLSYPGGTHNTEVEGEILEALVYRLGDVDGNDFVNVFDLISLFAVWGPCGDCLQDFNGDGQVNVSDLLVVLANWGPPVP